MDIVIYVMHAAVPSFSIGFRYDAVCNHKKGIGEQFVLASTDQDQTRKTISASFYLPTKYQ